MIELKKSELQGIVKGLEALSTLSKEIDQKLPAEIREMSPQMENDNYGTGDTTKRSSLSHVIKNLDVLDNLTEKSDALIIGIETVCKTL